MRLEQPPIILGPAQAIDHPVKNQSAPPSLDRGVVVPRSGERGQRRKKDAYADWVIESGASLPPVAEGMRGLRLGPPSVCSASADPERSRCLVVSHRGPTASAHQSVSTVNLLLLLYIVR